MTTLTIQGDNATINQILELIQGVKDKVIVRKDEVKDPIKDEILADLESYRNGEFISLDEIKAEVKDTIEQIKKGTMKLYLQQEYDKEMETFFKELV